MLRVSAMVICIIISCRSNSQSPGLLSAIKANDISLTRSLLEIGASLTEVDSDSDNVLMYAALYSTPACMELLLSAGANPNLQNKFGETALFWSVHDFEKAKLLLAHKASINHKSKSGNTPLLVACVGNDQDKIVRLLIENGADCKVKNISAINPLMQIALYGDTSLASLFLQKGIGINDMKTGGENALFLATKSLNKPMVSWLIQKGADVNLKDTYNSTVLAYAVVLNDVDLVKMIIPATKNINEQDIDGMSNLMWATYSEYDNTDIIRVLLQAGASQTLKDKNGLTARGWAEKKGNTETVKLLLKAETEGIK